MIPTSSPRGNERKQGTASGRDIPSIQFRGQAAAKRTLSMNFLNSHQRRDRWLALVNLSLLLTALAGRAAPLAPGQTLYDAAFGNGTFVAVGSTGSILSSMGGAAWAPRSSGVTNELRSVA